MQETQPGSPLGSIVQGRYVIERVLDKGKSGTIYLVKDVLKQHCIFVLKEVVYSKQADYLRLHFDSIKSLEHPALPRFFDVLNDDKHNRAYIVMDYVEGQTLNELRQMQPDQRFSLSQVSTIITPIMDAVIYLHNQHPPIIHQNISPLNIINSSAHASYILVGLSLPKESDSDKTIAVASNASNYKALEQYSGIITPELDVYSLGATVYTLLTGITPSNPFSRLKKLTDKQSDPLVPVNQLVSTIPVPVAEVIHRALSMDHTTRFSTVEHFWEELSQLLNPVTILLHQTEHITETALKESRKLDDNQSQQNEMELDTVAEKAPVVISPHESVRSKGVKKHGMTFLTLFAVIVTLLISLAVGTTLWSYTAMQHRPISGNITSVPQSGQVTSSPTASPHLTVTPTPAPVSSSNIATQYAGTLYDMPTRTTIDISLTHIQEQQGHVSGYFNTKAPKSPFNEVSLNSPFTGTIDTAKNIQFVVKSGASQTTFTFKGMQRSDGSITGTYCGSVGTTQECSSYGLWSTSPGS